MRTIREADASVARFLPVLDRQLAGKEFVLGGLSLLDFAVAPWLEAAPGLGVDLAIHANIKPWLSRLQAKPYWKDA